VRLLTGSFELQLIYLIDVEDMLNRSNTKLPHDGTIYRVDLPCASGSRYLVWFFDYVTVLLRLYVPGNPQSTELAAQPRSPKRSEKKGKRKMLKESSLHVIERVKAGT
jgi:hypothetical protein